MNTLMCNISDASLQSLKNSLWIQGVVSLLTSFLEVLMGLGPLWPIIRSYPSSFVGVYVAKYTTVTWSPQYRQFIVACCFIQTVL